MNRERVLVTGGAGYVGSHVCKALAGAGFTPVTYDNLRRGHEWAVRWGPFEAGELSDRARLDEVVKTHTPVAAMHFAALTYVEESVAAPATYYRNNVAGTLTLLEALRDNGILAMVFSSSAAIYGVPETSPIPESHPKNPVNPYGASKAMIERMLQDFDGAHGLRSASLRYFNAAGADPEAEIGE
ncbi:MAG: NAD-dependent epimerase/dehydratase family protein, partial [Rhodospirillales bacterium]